MKDDVFELCTSMFLNYIHEKMFSKYAHETGLFWTTHIKRTFWTTSHLFFHKWTHTVGKEYALKFIKSESLASLLKQCVVQGESSIGRIDFSIKIFYYYLTELWFPNLLAISSTLTLIESLYWYKYKKRDLNVDIYCVPPPRWARSQGWVTLILMHTGGGGGATGLP